MSDESINKRIESISPAKRALLMQLLERQKGKSAAVPSGPQRRGPGPAPLSFPQQRLWFLDQWEPNSPVYNIPVAVRLDGPLHLESLAQAINEIVRRHEVLRATFGTVDGQAVQVIAPSVRLSIPVEDLWALSASAQAAKVQERANQEARQPFTLAEGPLLRASLLRLDPRAHVLLLTMHHIVSDGWSIGLFFDELATLYSAFQAGKPSPLPDLPLQYADFAVWQRRWIEGEVREAQLTYWKQRLAGAPASLDLPADRPRPATPRFRGAVTKFALSRRLTADLHALAQHEGATPFMVLYAAFNVLLARYTGAHDICVGSPVAGRGRAEVEKLIGFFVHTLVLRTDLSGDPSFLELLGRVREGTLEAYDHQEVPFDQVVEALQPQRDPSRTPLFQVMFGLQNTPVPTVKLADLTLRPFEAENATAKFDLLLLLEATEEGMQGYVEYSTDLFERATIDRMVRHFQVLLEGLTAHPEKRIGELSVLTEEERERALVTWNATEGAYPAEACLHELFEQQVERTPSATAVVFQDVRMTYGELERRANQLGRALRERGALPNTLVAVVLDKGWEQVVAALGIGKSGAAYVPIDPHLPEERIRHLLEHGQVKLAVTHTRLDQTLGWPEGVERLCVETFVPTAEDDVRLARAQRPEDLAYVIYTSGSTGTPKGVMIDHRGPVNTVVDINRRFHVQPADRVLGLSALNFDLSVYDVFGTLAAGATLVLPDPLGLRDPSYWAEIVAAEGITVWNSVPALMELLVGHAAEHVADQLGSLRLVLLSGDWIPVSLPDRLKKLVPAVELISLGGATEASIWSIFFPIERVEPTWRSIPYGRPMLNQRFYVLDAALEPSPIGVEGMLFIGGVGVALGYWRAEELTSASFITHPRTGERLYRTGDQGRYMLDGCIEFLGRKDFQVKIRGFRIELGEIEIALGQHPAVREAVVLVRQDVPGDKRLVAYIVAADEPSPSALDLQSYLKGRLPEYMVPPAFVFLPAMPLTTNGKVDRRALPAPDAARTELAEGFAAPRSHLEQTLADVWAQVLGVPRVGIHDNFFALGGDSIIAIQVVSRAQRAGLTLLVRQLFQHQTVAALAKVTVTATGPRADQGRVTGPVPLTPIQYWFFAQDGAEPHHFNQAILLSDREPLDVRLLEEALEHLVEHHDALRLCFQREDGGYTQSHAPIQGKVLVAVVDLASVPADEQARAIAAAAAEIQSSLRLDAAPLLRAALFTLGGERKSRLLLVLHHLVVDGVSWRILLEDLQEAYRQRCQGEPVRLPPKTTSFKHWSEQLAAYVRSEAVRAELPYWLAASPSSALPRDASDGDNTVASARTVEVALSVEETQALLQDIPDVYRTQINDVLLTALVQSLTPWTGSRSLRVDLEGHGREEIGGELDLSRSVGWFTTIYPVALELSSGSMGEALKAIKEQLRRVPNRGLGHGILRYLDPDPAVRDALRALPQAEVLFNYLGQLDQDRTDTSLFDFAPESTGPEHSPQRLRTHLLEVTAAITGGQLRVGWTYSADRHQKATIEQLGRRFREALTALIAHCRSPGAGGRTPADFPLAKLSQQAVDRLVGAGRDVEDIYPLSPMQQGMLFHTLQEPSSGMYFEQLTFRSEGGLDTAAFRTAWEQVLARHPILRTAFVWEGLELPLQIVRPRATLPWTEHDWRALPPEAQQEQLSSLLAEDRARGFDIAQAPLQRLLLIRLTDSAFQCVWSFHHLLLDGWSLPILFKEVFDFYDGARHGKLVHLELPRPYRDYIAWLAREDLARAEAFFREVLRGFRAPTQLSIERLGAPAADPTASHLNVMRSLSEETTAALTEAARAHGLTLNTLVQGAWALLLSHYSGEDDVVFGATVSGRSTGVEGVVSMIGLFINTLPVRARLRQDAPLVAWLKELQDQQAAQLPYEYTPLAEVQRWSEIPRGRPLFSSLLVVENYPLDAAVEQGASSLAISDMRIAEKTNYPLALQVVPGKELSLLIPYATDRFDGATVARMLEHIEAILVGFVRAPERRLSELPLLTDEEQHRMVTTWNDPPSAYPDDTCVHHLFEAQVERSPDAIALVFEAERLTYRELNRRANQLAHHLRSLDVGPDVLVGLCLHRSIEMVVGALAVLKAGGAYVPLDPSYPADRLAFMIEDARVPVLLSQASLLDKLPAGSAHVVGLDTLAPSLAAQPEGNLPPSAGPSNLAYVIYTSGSTGKPKGVLLEHRGLCNLAEAQRRLFGVQVGTRVLQFARFGFDGAVWETFMALTAGGTLQLAPQDALIPGPDLIRLLREAEINVIALPPSALAVLPEEPLPALHTMIVAGEACSADLVARWAPGRRFFNSYGPTETTVCVTNALCTPGGGAPVIGRPLSNVQVYVLDAYLRPVPVGVPGELYVGGVNLARGYLNQPARTAEVFIRNSFSDQPGARLYKTGDLVRWLPDSNLEYLGRVDHQIKLRGFRIEPGEIEATLAQHPAVREAVVMAREDVPGDKRLVAYLTTTGASLPSTSELRSFLLTSLPDYMVPGVFVAMEAMPLTPNGKIDRRALPAPEAQESAAGEDFVPARTPIEEVLAAIWAEVLRCSRVSCKADFFELGGHSLLATQVLARLRASFGVELPLRALFEAPTVSGLALHIEAARRAKDAAPPLPPLEKAPRDRALPLSFAQQRLWFLEQLEPDSALYSVPTAVRILGPLHVDALEQAVREVMCRHEALRTTFVATHGRPRQVIASEPSLRLERIDLEAFTGEAREAEVQRRVLEEVQRPFNLAEGPLVCATLLRLGDGDHVLTLTLHHIVADGWSMGILIKEVAVLYDAFQTGKPSPLPPLPLQYADYAVWQRVWLDGEVRDAQLAYWKRKLAGAPPSLNLPTDRPRPPLQTFRGAAVAFQLPERLITALTAVSRRAQVTRFMALLAAFQALLARYAGVTDVSVGSPIAGRGQAETEGLIGFFVNTLVLRADLSGDPSFLQLLERVRELTLDAYAHQDVPFEQVVDALAPVRDPSRTPLFQVLFVLQNLPLSALSFADLTLTPIEGVSTTARFDLMLALNDVDGGMEGVLEYNTDLFDASTIQRMIGHFERLLSSATEVPERRLSELSILSAEERHELLVTRNDTKADVPEVRAHALFEAQAARAPDAIAVVFGDAQLTYGALDRRANQLAHHLRARGVGPDALVGICMERSLEMVVGMLGVLKAGGAYVPLDPAYPTERLAFMMKDAELLVLLTQERLVGRLPASPSAVVCLEPSFAAIAAERDDRPSGAVHADNLAYVIYTSGSTGKPKGVMIHHRGLVNYLDWCTRAYAVAEGQGVPVHSSLAFDLTVTSVLAPLAVGQRIELLPDGPGVDALAAALRDGSDISLLKITPSHLDALVQDPTAVFALAKVRTFVIGGEALTAASVAALRVHATDARVINEYGPTETVVGCCIEEVPPSFAAVGAVPIGRPIRNTQLYVLDPRAEPVPIGVTGELYIGGAGVARGYVDRPALTAERFVPDPFGGEPGARLYRTGDLARFRADGALDFLGRIDHQVKIRGYRIELGEIDAVLAEHPDVREAVVLAREDKAGDKRLVAYVVLRSAASGLDEVRAFLQARLPDYMVPSAFVVLETLPLSVHGKIDRAALPAPDSASANRDGPLIGPRDNIELALVQLWEELLDITPVGVQDDFFALGGHSLLAVQLLAGVQDRFGKALPLSTLFQKATVEAMAQQLREGAESLPWSPLVQIQPGGPGRPLFLVHPSGGTVLCYAALARHVGQEWPVYGLQARGTEGDLSPLDRIEEMAVLYLEAVRSVQPEGPYALGGWSFGGLVAIEMARQLQKDGQEVAILALLDTSAVTPALAYESWDDATFLADLATLQRIDVPPEVLRSLGPDELLPYFLDLAHKAHSAPPSFGVPQLAQWLRVYRTHYEAFQRYRPSPYAGRITLFRAGEGSPLAARRGQHEERGASLGWGELSPFPVEVHEVPGDHESLVSDPHVITLAARLRECLLAAPQPAGAGQSR
jgi:amino acid adenylation domain-containing protein/non-ribosomal peptide synthase protein (TIGR01720 family)